LTAEQETWAETIDLYFYEIYSALEDSSVGYDVNGYVKKAADITCDSLFNYGLGETEITEEICNWLLTVIAEPICYWDEWYE